jgi:sugar lactone lactonase YvrE
MLLVGIAELGKGLLEVDPTGKIAPRMINEDIESNAFAQAPDGFLYGPSYETVIKIDLKTGTFEALVDGFIFSCSVRYNPRDGYLYVLETIPGTIYRVALDGSSKQLFATLSADYLADNFAIAKDGSFLVTRFSGPIVTRVSPDGATAVDYTIGE